MPAPSYPADLSTTALRIFDSLPVYYQWEPTIARLMQAEANEFDRLDAYAQRLARSLSPAGSGEEPKLLALWEHIMHLPVEPAGVSIAERVQVLIAAFIGRNCTTTAEWLAGMRKALGSVSWKYQVCVPGPGQITITVPYVPGSYVEGIVKTQARRLTPANYEIVFAFAGGWIAGVSEPGDAA